MPFDTEMADPNLHENILKIGFESSLSNAEVAGSYSNGFDALIGDDGDFELVFKVLDSMRWINN